MPEQRSIVLCGFMGCGKSTVGKRLARRLGMEFCDLDHEIEQTNGMPIAHIFEQQGEAEFRRMETAALRILSARHGLVIATGGGALLRQENANAAHEGGARVVLLDCSFSLCYQRICNSDRPLVRRNTPQELEALYNARLPLYRNACDTAVATASPDQTVDAICAALLAL